MMSLATSTATSLMANLEASKRHDRMALTVSVTRPQRATALVDHLPATQTLVTTAGALPDGIRADAWLRVDNGSITR